MKFRGYQNLCPICGYKITRSNALVVYHIRYDPPLVILACKYCNYTEMLLRNNKVIPRGLLKRAEKVLSLNARLGVKI
jgi:hypothetical protein